MLEHAQLFFQPQISAADTKFIGVECLLREVLPDGRIDGPARLLAVAEDAGETAELDWWVLQQAVIASRRWPGLSLAINVSAAQFFDSRFPTRLADLLSACGASPSQIELELLEGGLIQNFDKAVETIDALRGQGMTVSLDDFGTGYSSLSYLQRLPIDKLKLDKSMVEGVGQLKATAVIQAVCALSRALGIKVLAEGVETAEQVAMLRTLGCHQYQGFYFSRAVSGDAIDDLLASGWPSLRP